MGLEISGLVSDHGIRRGMGLVEPVSTKFFDQTEQLLSHPGLNVVFLGSIDKPGPMLGHNLRLFLSHRLSEFIGFRHGVFGQYLSNFHHLFLV